MNIREASAQDFDNIWPIFNEVVSTGDTYACPPNTTKDQAFNFWITEPKKTFVAEDNGEIVGTYYIKSNQEGQGNHVCNCGYMVAAKFRRQGLATAMCEHSQQTAKKLGYKAMQYNFVVSTNQGSAKLWPKLGFEIVGRLPKAFNHPSKGYVDALVMYKWL